jgi:hypothetical protein
MTTMACRPSEDIALQHRAEERFAAGDWAAAAYLWSQLADAEGRVGGRQAHDIARCHALLGDGDRALAWLERAVELGFRDWAAIGADDAFAALRSDPRFAERAGLDGIVAMPRDESGRRDHALVAGVVRRLRYCPFER